MSNLSFPVDVTTVHVYNMLYEMIPVAVKLLYIILYVSLSGNPIFFTHFFIVIEKDLLKTAFLIYTISTYLNC